MDSMEPYRVRRASLMPEDALVLNRHAGQVYDPAIQGYRPQRTSLLPNGNSPIMWDAESRYLFSEAYPDSRRTSISSYASFGTGQSTYSVAPTTATSLGSRRSSFTIQQRSRSILPPAPVFKNLPVEIYECILRQLRISHLGPNTQSCDTCYLRDLFNLALVSRPWDKAVRSQLYDRIHIVGQDHPAQIKKYKMKTGVRLKLLRRTLRERRLLANLVRELKVPNLIPEGGAFPAETIDLVASVVMACPNLERLIGFHHTYHHTFDRLTYALSTRKNLKSHVWLIGENDAVTARSQIQLPPGLMDREQAESFLEYHERWRNLTTLFLHSQPGAILEHDIIATTLSHLPSLQHLALSSFDPDDFNDSTLAHLPPLLSLRLEDLTGLTDSGLSRLATSHTTNPLTSLSLLHLPLTSLLIISKLLAHLHHLTRFTLLQALPLTLDPTDLIIHPLLASPSLTHLHWDIQTPDPSSTAPLAASISASGFPSLLTLRAPTDPSGLLQSLCRPRATIVLPADKYSTHRFAPSSSSSSSTPSTLYSARQAAQARIEAAQQTVAFRIIVDEEGVVNEVWDLQGFVGTVGSQITYSLKPDVPGSEEPLAGWTDLRGVGREVEPRDGCTGLWNASHPAGKKWWGHGERGRWAEVGLERFF